MSAATHAPAFWLMALRTPMAQLYATANPAMHVQGWTIVGAMALTVVWAARPALVGRRSS